jgi:hypothetical protein
MDHSKQRRRARKCTAVTIPDPVGLPSNEHGIWLMGHAHLRTALAVCDAVAALGSVVVEFAEPNS